MTIDWIEPDWGAPARVHAVFTRRSGGVSAKPWESLNLALHVHDRPDDVILNRERLRNGLNLPAEPVWMNQVHASTVLEVGREEAGPWPGATADGSLQRTADGSLQRTADGSLQRTADGSYTTEAGVVLVMLVADCLPVFLCNRTGTEIAVLHAGWRGLAGGVIVSGLQKFRDPVHYAWIGPGIGPCHFEVDEPVVTAFHDYEGAILEGRDRSHWFVDLREIAKTQLRKAGVRVVTASNECTWCCREDYFSARRDGECGRMAALVWRDEQEGPATR